MVAPVEEQTQMLADAHALLISHASFLGGDHQSQISSRVETLAELCADEQYQEAIALTNSLMDLVCEAYQLRLEETVADRGFASAAIERLKQQIPRGEGVAPHGVNANLIAGLELFPEGKGIIAEAHLSDNSEMFDLAREGFAELSHPPVHDPDSHLTWYLATTALEVPQVDCKAFLERMQRFIEIKQDATQRVADADHTYQSWTESIAANKFFGSDVPFMSIASNEEILPVHMIPQMLGHDVLVVYLRKEGVYALVSYPREMDFGDFQFSKHVVDLILSDGVPSSGKTGPLGGNLKKHYAIAIDREEAKAALAQLRKGKLNFSPVRAQTGKGLGFRDPFEHKLRHDFLGQTCPEPLAPIAIHELQASAQPMALQPDRSYRSVRTPQTIADGVRITLSSDEDLDFPKKLGIEITGKLPDKDWERIEKVLGGITSARLVIWSNGRASIILNRSIKIPAQFMLPPEAIKPEQKWSTYYGYQSFSSRKDWNLFGGAPEVPQGHARFNLGPRVLDYSALGKLELGVPINRNTMELAFDPALKRAGIASKQLRIGGKRVEVNCLSDRWGYSIPLVKPSGHQFQNRALRRVKPLEVVPAASWPRYVKALQGRYLESIPEITIDPALQAGEPKPPGGMEFFEAGVRPVSDEFYSGSAKSVIPVGAWISFHCERGPHDYYVLDCPDPAYNAIYVFRTLEASKKWAEIFQNPQRGIARVEALRDLDCIGRIIHTDRYLERLESLLDRRLVRLHVVTP
ncbi:hypothetical protein OAO01_00525 [Oligoflexia bacterium]|nr:hypothetical protein [Oligoflexia bacterium]